MTELLKKIDKAFENKFSSFWIHFLSHNVLRTRFLIKKIANINDALIIQAISWHHYLLSIQDNEALSNSTYNEALNKWNEDFSITNKKLTISNVADLTSIPFETVRRHVIYLQEKGWIKYSRKNGIIFNSKSEINNIIFNEIHPYEKNLIKKALNFFLKAYNS